MGEGERLRCCTPRSKLLLSSFVYLSSLASDSLIITATPPTACGLNFLSPLVSIEVGLLAGWNKAPKRSLTSKMSSRFNSRSLVNEPVRLKNKLSSVIYCKMQTSNSFLPSLSLLIFFMKLASARLCAFCVSSNELYLRVYIHNYLVVVITGHYMLPPLSDHKAPESFLN